MQSTKPLFAVLVAGVLVVGLFVAAGSTGPSGGPTAAPEGLYDPVRAGEELPQGFRQLLNRDSIHPVYDPAFRPASGIGWSDDTLVIGVAFDGEAKAYPVSHLNRREMVIDSLAGIPILVTW